MGKSSSDSSSSEDKRKDGNIELKAFEEFSKGADNKDNLEERLKKQKFNILAIILISCLLIGPFMHGEMVSALGNELPIRSHFALKLKYTTDPDNPSSLPNIIWSLGFLFPFGGLFGALTAAHNIDAYGRKRSTIAYILVMIIGNVLKIVSFYSHIAVLFIGRFFDGFASAAFMVTATMWMFELLPTRLHNAYKPLIQMIINLGVFFTGFTQINRIMGSNWHFTYFSCIIFACIMMLACSLLPESPKWTYFKKNDRAGAQNALKFVRGRGYIQDEFDELVKNIDEEKKLVKITLLNFIKEKRFTAGTISSIMLQLGQQITGINAVNGFAIGLLANAGVKNSDEMVLVIYGLGVISSLIFTPMISNFPRKYMLILGHLGMALTFSFNQIFDVWRISGILQVVCMGIFVFLFNIGPGPLPWFITVEIFPANSIGGAQGMLTAANWIGNTFVFLLFPIVEGEIGINALYIFIALNVIMVVFFHILLVETIGKNTDEVLLEYKERYKFMLH